MWTYRVDDRAYYQGPLRVMAYGEVIFVIMEDGEDYTYVASQDKARRICRRANEDRKYRPMELQRQGW